MARVDLIFVNTLTHGHLLKIISNPQAKVVTYVHELRFVTSFFNEESDVRFLLSNSDIIATPCKEVANYLTQSYKVDSQKIKRLNYYIDLTHVNPNNSSGGFKVPSDKFIVVGCGTIDYRKGFDLFYQTVSSLISIREKSDFRFYWIGQNANDAFSIQSFLDIQKLNLDDALEVIPEVENVFDYLKEAHVFFLSSREDPYPVVVLEAALLSVPTVCFDGSGGIVEFIEEDAGWTVPYLDTHSAAQKINFLMDNRSVVTEVGAVAKAKVLNKHNAEIVKQQMKDILN